MRSLSALLLAAIIVFGVPGASGGAADAAGASGPGAAEGPGDALSVAPSEAGATLPVWRWPLTAPHPILRPYLAPATPYAAGHRGIDVKAADDRVLAPASGTVHFAGVVVDRPVLSIRHGNGIISSYEPVQSELSAGDAVVAGQQVGTLLPGHCTRICLHFGVRIDGEYVSPLLLLGGIPRSVLLPTRSLG